MPTERDKEIADLWADVAMPVQNVILNANLEARGIIRHRERTAWLAVGRGLSEIRAEAQRRAGVVNSLQHPRYRHFKALLMTKAPDLAALEETDHAGCQHAVWMFKTWEAVGSWLATLPPAEQNRLNHPSGIRRRFDAVARKAAFPEAADRPPPAPRKEARQVEPLAPEAMAPTMRERYEASLRAARKQIREELRAEVTAEVGEVFEVSLTHWRKRVAEAERIFAAHKGVISRAEFRKIKACLHPDQNPFAHAAEVFQKFSELEKVLVKPDEPVFTGPPLPKTAAELMARRRHRNGHAAAG